MKRERTTQVVVAPPLNRVVRYKVDLVGNDLTAVLRWCETHCEPVWQFSDGSYECPHTWIVKFDDKTHVLVDGPWETENVDGR